MNQPLLNDLTTVERQRLLKLARSFKFKSKTTDKPGIERMERSGKMELSYAQQRLWFLAQMEGVSEAYHIPTGIGLRGVLDVGALRGALNRVVERHEVLRTTFHEVDGEAEQRITPVEDGGFDLIEQDLRDHKNAKAELEGWIAAEARTTFDLRKGPLIRGRLIRMGEEEHVLLMTMHHIVSDGWSMGVLMEEVSRLYGAFARGEEDPLPELGVQYADYAAWQRRWMSGEVLGEQGEYWKKALEGAPGVLELPGDHARPARQDYAGAYLGMEIGEELTAGLKGVSQRQGVTLYMTLLGGWAAVLGRLSGQRDVVIGTPVANRGRKEIEGLIGFFVNTLAVRVDLRGSPSVGEMLKRVKRQALEGQQHQEIPFEQVVEVVKPGRSLGHSPVFQVMFAWQNAPEGRLELEGMEVVGVEGAGHRVAKFDVTLALQEVEGRIVGGVEYATSLYEGTTMERYLGYYRRMLEGMVKEEAAEEEEEGAVDRIELLSEEERRQLLEEWNETEVEYARGKCVHELFEEQEERSPEAVAVVFEEQMLSYGELNRRANRLGHYLRGLGVKADERVAICLERGLEMVVALLAVLKAGGAYVPLDPGYPEDRLRWMRRDSGARVLLTQESLRERLVGCDEEDVGVVNLDGDAEEWEEEGETNPERGSVGLTARHLAYVIYTSGSTGTPKGVMVEHEGVCNLVAAQIRAFGVEPESRVLQFASFSFDASVSEIFIALCRGASLHFIPRCELRAGDALIRIIWRNGITHATLPSAVLTVLPESEDLAQIRTLVVAGDVLTHALAKRWVQGRRLINAYGPTEATVCATLHDCRAEDIGNPPIGRPMANTRIYVLDEHRQPVPVGVVGELYIAGAGVARGYLNREELTAERFVADPFVNAAEARMYKTGDLGKWLEDGRIEFRGRNDDQVKIRGYRIELGEIEARLRQHPLVRETIVIAREDTLDDKRLIAYVVPRKSESIELWPSVGEYFVYDDLLYHAMTHDERRNRSYKVAIGRAVRDRVVVEIGTGKDAILARFCVEAGARRVYAIELLEESFKKAKVRVEQLGLEDKIILIHGDMTKVELPEKADVCVSEIVGPIGGCEGAALLINDAWRFMKPGGIMIPERAVTRIAAVSLPDAFLENPQFSPISGPYVDKIFKDCGYKFDLRLCLRGMNRDHLISTVETFEDLDHSSYAAAEYQREEQFTVTRSSRIDGFLVWLNLYTAHDEMIDILDHEHCWLPVFFPVFYPGVQVSRGDTIHMRITGTLCDNGLNPDYKLEGQLIRQTGEVIGFEYDSFHHKSVYKQTPFYEFLFGTEPLRIKTEGQMNLSLELRAHLSATLPEYMVPSGFVSLEEMPLTANGKVDRKRLPAPGGDAYATRGYEAPCGEIESSIAAIWGEVLKVERVGRKDNFFELGGHSLLAVRVMSRVREALQVEARISDLFARPVLEDFAKGMASAAHCELPGIERMERSGKMELSYAQQRLWFLAQMEGVSEAYHIPTGIGLRGVLDVGALRGALNRVVERHEVLRTTFHEVDGEAEQRITPVEDGGFDLIEQDLRDHKNAKAELEGWIAAEARTTFDLRKGPLIRGRLIRMGEEEHVLLMTMHHIVSDGWSMGVLMEEVSRLYGAFARGEEDPLPELGVQYADYAAWQRRWMSGEVLGEQGEYWKKALEGAPGVLELPGDHARPARQDYAGAYLGMEIGEELTAGLKGVSQRQGVTLYMTLLGGWAAVLGRLSGQRDVVIGTPVANRGRKEIEGLIGFFVNTLAVRVDLRGSPSVGEMLKRVKRQALEGQQHQEIPFEQVVEVVKPGRSLGHSPVFQVMFAWQNAPEGRLELEGMEVVGVEGAGHRVAKFDVTLALQEVEGRIVGGVEYATSLYEGTTMERYLGYYRRMLEGMVKEEEAEEEEEGAVDRIELLSEEERRQLLEEWNETGEEYARGKCVHELFEEQEERSPEAVAVVFEEQMLSYGELNRRANRLGHYLRGLGVGVGERVVTVLNRSIDLVVAELAILKCGAAYVPLDPAFPSLRQAYMIGDSGAKVVVSREDIAELTNEVPREGAVTRVNLDTTVLGTDEKNLDEVVDREGLAYVMYTSGSTGEPKGVMVPHRAIARLVIHGGYAEFAASDRVGFAANPAFDATTMEVWAPLLNGGRMVVIAQDVLLEPKRLGEMLQRQRVNVLWMTVGLFNQYTEALREEFSKLRYLMVGGEALDPRVMAGVLREGRPEHLINGYGPTETTTFAVTHEIVEVGEKARSIPIGRPIGNTRVYILDEEMEPVPVGVSGEMYIGGAGVALGYLNRPELTAEKFMGDPFVKGVGARMYRTGDVGKWLGDGTMEFVGRNDEQVKVRGYRIELGEIEARLASYPGVGEAVVVVVREDEPGEKRLVAYYTSRDGNASQNRNKEEEEEDGVKADELRSHLAAKLPEYMVPAVYVRVEQMPLTANGKLDRKALPKPEGGAYAARGYEAPEGEIETTLAAIWEEVLKVERVGRRDNFFELGGHSLLALTLVERMRLAGFTVDVGILFAAPTLAELAVASGGASSPIDVPANRIPGRCAAIRPGMLTLVEMSQEEIDRVVGGVVGGARNVQEIYPLAPLQEGILFHHRMGGEGDPYLLANLFRLDTRARLDRYAEALQKVMDRHDILRTAVVWEGLREPVQVVWREAKLEVEEVVLQGGDAGEQLYERFDPRHYRMDVRQAPLLRMCVARDGERGGWLMVLLLHHLAGDHTTVEVMQEEIQAYLLGEGERLPAPQPFRNLVAQARLGVSEKEHEVYFREMLGGVEEPTAPFGVVEVQGDGGGIEEARMLLEGVLAGGLRERARKLRVSAASLCHVAWARVLGKVSGRKDVVFGTVVFGRMQGGAGAERGMGLFINTLPVRIEVGEGGVEASVRRVHGQLGELMRHEHASLALAQRCSGVRAPTPLFTALLNYRHSAGVARGAREEGVRAWEGMEWLRGEERTNYPVTLSVDDFGEGIGLTAQVVASIEAKRVCEYMRQALESLVGALESAPGRAVRSLEVLPEKERRQLLYEWNDTAAEYPSDKCIHELFEEQVEKSPQATALMFEEESLSYEELNRRANRLGHYLGTKGVGPDGRVAICMERGIEMVVALLAVLKAGGAYVPLDPAYPEERLRWMLEDSDPAALLTQGRLQDLFRGWKAGLPVVDVTEAVSAWKDCPETNLACADVGLTPQHLAYVIYTSGSTGRPKGVMVSHQNLVSSTFARKLTYGNLGRFLLLSPMSFDSSVAGIFGTLTNSGTLVVAADDVIRDPFSLNENIQHLQVETLLCIPSLYQQLLEYPVISAYETKLTRVIVAGSPCPPTLVAKSVQYNPRVVLFNEYGPTEGTVWATAHVCVDAAWQQSVPIGRPIANARIYILDENREPVPVGVKGELFIGGAGVARGYLNRTELTAERFVRDPFVADAKARMYKTGDLGEWLADGTIDFIGRNDDQVKIRGYRIELGEIEARIGEHPLVRDAVVMAREDEPGEKRLVAYFTIASRSESEAESISGEELRRHIASKLPAYMAPAAYVRLETLPLTPNGKIDRKALPKPELTTATISADGSRWMRTPDQVLLCSLFEEALGVAQVRLDDNFFDLGGHSLLAARLVDRIRAALGLEISIRTLFEAPTVAALTTQKNITTDLNPFAVMLPLRSQGALPPLFFIHPGAGLSWCYAGFLKHAEAQRPIYGLQTRNFTSPARTAEAIEEMAADYADEIRKIQPTGPYHLVGWSSGGLIAHSIATKLQSQDQRVALLAILDTVPFAACAPDGCYISELEAQGSPNMLDLAAEVFDLKPTADSTDLSAFYNRLRREGRLPGHFSERHFLALMENYQAAGDLGRRFVPGVHDGDLLVFVATVGRSGVDLDVSAAWRPHVAGDIRIYPIAAKHLDMMNSSALAEIGRVLMTELQNAEVRV